MAHARVEAIGKLIVRKNLFPWENICMLLSKNMLQIQTCFSTTPCCVHAMCCLLSVANVVQMGSHRWQLLQGCLVDV